MHRHWRVGLAAFVGLGVIAGLAAAWLGGRIYDSHCAACHGSNLEGQADWQRRRADGYMPAPPHDETGHTWHHSDEQLFQITKYGVAAILGSDYRSNMAGFWEILGDGEIRAVLGYIKSRWPESIRSRQSGIGSRATH